MKLLHLGDLHLGKALGDYDLTEDQQFILKQITDLAKARSVDAVLIAGDVYDKSIPSEAATRLLNDFLLELSEAGIKVFMISGNHDSDERLNFGSKLFKLGGIYIASKFEGSLCQLPLKDEYGEVNVCLLPFVKASQVRHFYPDAKINSYDDAVRVIIEQADIDTSRRNIIVAHQFVTGRSLSLEEHVSESTGNKTAQSDSLTAAYANADLAGDKSKPLMHDEPAFEPDTRLSGSESAGTLSVGLVEMISCSCFDAFDYAALGHIHAPQRVGRDTVRYSGSPLKFSLSEANSQKSVPLITLGSKGDIDIELIPLKPLRDLRHIKGPLSKLLDKANVTAPDDFIYATLTDEDIINDAIGIFRQVYPNTVKIDYDNSHTRAVEEADIAKIIENKTFSELIGDFYHMMYGCDISDEELQCIRQIAEESGITE